MDSGAQTLKTMSALILKHLKIILLLCTFYGHLNAKSSVVTDELKLLIESEKSLPLHQIGTENLEAQHRIYLFTDSTAWNSSMRWFRKHATTIIKLEDFSLTIIYYPEKRGFFRFNAQTVYDAKIKAQQLIKNMEIGLSGNQILRLRSLPIKVLLDKDRRITRKLGAPRHRPSALVWQKSTNKFRSFHQISESSISLFKMLNLKNEVNTPTYGDSPN